MFDIITKREYWEWQDAGFVDPSRASTSKGFRTPTF